MTVSLDPRHRACRLLCGTAAIALIAASPAIAGDLSISTATTEAVATATGDGSGPGAINIVAGGSVAVDAGSAVTINSDHNVSALGAITSNAESNGVGIDIVTPAGGTRSAMVELGAAVRVGPADNGIPEPAGPNFGIRVGGPGSFVGDITTTSAGSITVEGLSSFGIDIAAPMTGDLTLGGALSVVDQASTALRISGSLTGDIVNSGAISGAVRDGGAVDILGNVSGRLRNQGTISAGFTTQVRLDAEGVVVVDANGFQVFDTITSTAPTVHVAADIGNGILNFGDSRTEAEELAAILDGTAPTGDDIINDGIIASVGAANAIRISGAENPGGARAITIGAAGSGDEAFGLVNRGVIRSDGSRATLNAETIFIGGGSGFATTLAGGINNIAGDIVATAVDATATAIHVGAGGVVPEIRNSGAITASSGRSQTFDTNNATVLGPGGTVFGIVIDAGASVTRFDNSGVLGVSATGPNTSATAFLDRSGSLTEIINSGLIQAIQGDARETGDTGTLTALDLSASTANVSLTNSGTIDGAVFLGAGNDLIVFDGGSMAGDLRLSGGANRLELRGGADFSADRFDAQGGTLDLLVEDARINLSNIGGSAVTNAEFADGAVFGVVIDASDNTAPGFVATNNLAFRSGARIDLSFGGFSVEGGTVALLSASNLVIEDPISEVIEGELPFLYNFTIGLDPNNPNRLQANFVRKTAVELGLNANTTSLYDAVAPALAGDDGVGAVVANVANQGELLSHLAQLRPVGGVARYRAAIETQDIAVGAVARRMSSLRLLEAYDQHVEQYGLPRKRDRLLQRAVEGPMQVRRKNDETSIWVQEFGHAADQKGGGAVTGYDGFNFGIAMGADRPMLGLAALGFSISQIWGDYSEDGPGKRKTSYTSTQLNFYGSWRPGGGLYAEASAGAALNSNSVNRQLRFPGDDLDGQADDIVRDASASWSGNQFHAGGEVGFDKRLGHFRFNPGLTASYLRLHESGYQEAAPEGDTSSALLSLDGGSATSLRGGAKLDITGVFPLSNVLLTTVLRGGALREFGDHVVTSQGSFQGGGDAFRISDSTGSKNSYFVGAGMGYTSRDSTFSLDYNREKRGDFIGHSLSAHVRFQF